MTLAGIQICNVRAGVMRLTHAVEEHHRPAPQAKRRPHPPRVLIRSREDRLRPGRERQQRGVVDRARPGRLERRNLRQQRRRPIDQRLRAQDRQRDGEATHGEDVKDRKDVERKDERADEARRVSPLA